MFNKLKHLERDEIFSVNKEFTQDSRRKKVNCGIGVYLDPKGLPYIMPVVKQAIKHLNLSNFNYLPISGDPEFINQSIKLVLGTKLYSSSRKRIAAQGVMGGTNGLYTWGLLIKKVQSRPQIIISQPTWGNQRKIYEFLGFKIIDYPHLDFDNKFNFTALTNTITKNPKAHVLFHAGLTHNPTGVNPDKIQWQALAKQIKRNKIQVLFDQAYLGMGQSINLDSFACRHFIQKNISTSAVLSFSKIMSLYQHRSGLLFTYANSFKQAQIIEDNYQSIFRVSNSNPAALGEILVKLILTKTQLKASWLKSLSQMTSDIKNRRRVFAQYAGPKFKFVTQQFGMYSLLGLNHKQVEKLKADYGIYLLSNSRINFGGLSYNNISYVAQAILKVTKNS